MDHLHHEIQSLQASVRRQRYAIYGLSAVLAGTALLGAARSSEDATFDMVTCRGWQVVDKDGTVRIAAATDADGKATVQWFDTGGKVRIAAATLASGDSGLEWFGKDGKKRINAATIADGSSGVSWFDANEKWRVAVVTAADGSAGLLVLGQDGKPQIEASTSANGSTTFAAPAGGSATDRQTPTGKPIADSGQATEVPPPISDEELAALSKSDALELINRVAKARTRTTDPAIKERLRSDFDRLMQHIRSSP